MTSFSFFRLGALAALLLAAPGLARPSHAQAGSEAFTAPQRQAIERIVREYLVAHPEVLQEAMTEFERRQAESQRQAQQAALRSLQDTLASSSRGAVFGNPQGDVTLVEFFDYNCGYCKRALGDVRALIKADPKLKVVVKDFPVLGPDSVEAHRIAIAAKNQLSGDKLFEYHARLMETRGRVTAERALAVAREMGLDTARIQKEAASPEVTAAIAEAAALGDKLSLTGTPAFVVGDEVISGAVGVGPLAQAIASVRKCGQAAGC